ncbi:unnamed protein product [Dicrocoelium dendriticum]|nr:unnamed protein product [Dicrocoelium dendriticum]
MALQRALDKLWEWSVLWLLPINRAKCSVLRIGASDSSTSYALDGTVLPHVTHQVDLGVVTWRFPCLAAACCVKYYKITKLYFLDVHSKIAARLFERCSRLFEST